MSKLYTILKVAACVSLTWLFICKASTAQTIATPSVSLSKTVLNEFDSSFTISIQFDSSPADTIVLSGFDLTFQFHNNLMQLTNVTPGDYLINCGWEYFNYRTDTISIGGPLNPTTAIQIIAVADINNSTEPLCDLTGPGELAVMTFEPTQEYLASGGTTHLYWLWTDCGDNLFSNMTGTTLYSSNRVYSPDLYDITSDTIGFPTIHGAPASCSQNVPPNDYLRTINYIAGAVTYYTDTIMDTIITTPDIPYVSFPNFTVTASNTPIVVPIKLTKSALDSLAMGGFDLLFQYDDTKLQLTSAEMGQALETCEWEYFTYRVGTIEDPPNAPIPTIRVTSISNVNDCCHVPVCDIESGGEIVRLMFEPSESFAANGGTTQFKWIWKDCGDNVFANPNGDELYLSKNVFSHYLQVITNDTIDFPSIYGTSITCIDTSYYAEFFRNIDYISGQLTYIGTGDTTNQTLNEPYLYIPTQFAYETDSLITIPIQYNTSPFDSLTISGFDLLINYDLNLLNVVSAEPGANLNNCGWEYFTYRTGAITDTCGTCPIETIRIVAFADISNSTHPLCNLTSSGEIARITFAPTAEFYNGSEPAMLNWLWNDCGDNVLANQSGNVLYGSDDVFSPDLTVITNQSATFPTINGAPSTCSSDSTFGIFRRIDFVSGMITPISDSICCELRGNINGDKAGFISIDDVVYLVDFMFKNGPAPICIDEADINGLGAKGDIVDLIYLINYMFLSGPPPVSCF